MLANRTIFAMLMAGLLVSVGCETADEPTEPAETAAETKPVEPQPTAQAIDVDLGSHVLGPKLEVDDLTGKVVVFEYWGDRCPPCHASIPSIVSLRSEYGSDKLQIVANQVWTKDADATKAAWEKHGGDDTVTVINHGALPQSNHRGVPHAYILDHNGELIWHGNPHPRADGEEMKKTVKEAVAALPDQG